MRTADKPMAHSQQGSLCPWGVCVAFCDLKRYECFKLLLNLASNTLDLVLDLLCKLSLLKKLLGGPVVKGLSDGREAALGYRH